MLIYVYKSIYHIRNLRMFTFIYITIIAFKMYKDK